MSGRPAATAAALRSRRIAPATLAGAVLLLVLLAAFPYLVRSYLVSLGADVLVFAVFALSLDLLLGYTGLASFGHAAFFGVGGYVAAYVALGLSANLLVVLPFVVAATLVATVVIGYLSLRTSGVYFLMLTLAFAQMLYGLTIKWTSVTGGSDGLTSVPAAYLGVGPWRWSFGTNLHFYYLAVAAFLGSWWLLHRIVRSPFGHTLRGIKENETRMQALGYDTWRYKMASFMIAGVFAGFAGALFTFFNRHAAPDSFYWTTSGAVLLMVIIGGAGTLSGPILGAALVRLFPSFVSTYTDRWQTALGLVFIGFVLFAPGGIIGIIRSTVRRVRGRAPG